MIKKIEADAFLEYFGKEKPGMSKPVCIIGSDGKNYVLKNQNVFNGKSWTKWDTTFFNELLVYQIAEYLNLKVPQAAIVNIDKSFIEAEPSLRFEHNFQPGLHFGTELINGTENNLVKGYQILMMLGKPYTKRSWHSFFSKINNKNDIAKIIVLDFLTGNYDRFGNHGNLLVASQNKKRFVYPIDHGHCFRGPKWEIHKQQFLLMQLKTSGDILSYVESFFIDKQSDSGLGMIFDAIEQHIDLSDPSNHSFVNAVYATEKINDKRIEAWMSEIPDDWFIDKKSQINAHTQFLLNQKTKMRNIIDCLIKHDVFKTNGIQPGGVLKWKEQKTGTQ